MTDFRKVRTRIPATPIDKDAPPPQPFVFTGRPRSTSSGEYVLSLRDRGVSWQNVSKMTGIPVPTLQALYSQREAA